MADMAIDGDAESSTSIRGRADHATLRMTVPPRREKMREDYETASHMAVLDREQAEAFQEQAREAHTMRRFYRETRLWDEACHAIVGSVKQRELELHLRKEEVRMYGHLDDEREQQLLRGRIEYTERRIIRLRDDKELLRLKASIAHLEQKVADYNNQLDLLKKRIQAENLQDKTQWPVSSGTGWGGNDEGFRRPRMDNSHNPAASRLTSLKYEMAYIQRNVKVSTDELLRNEDDWSDYKEKIRIQKRHFDRLDENVKRFEQGLRPIDFAAHDRQEALSSRQKEERRLATETERRRQQAEAHIRASVEAEARRQAEIEKQNQWEAEYGEALEEDPAFTAPQQGPSEGVDEAQLKYAGMSLGDASTPLAASSEPASGSITGTAMVSDAWGSSNRPILIPGWDDPIPTPAAALPGSGWDDLDDKAGDAQGHQAMPSQVKDEEQDAPDWEPEATPQPPDTSKQTSVSIDYGDDLNVS